MCDPSLAQLTLAPKKLAFCFHLFLLVWIDLALTAQN